MKLQEMTKDQLKEKLMTFTLETATPEEIAELKEIGTFNVPGTNFSLPTIMITPIDSKTPINTGVSIEMLQNL